MRLKAYIMHDGQRISNAITAEVDRFSRIDVRVPDLFKEQKNGQFYPAFVVAVIEWVDE